MDAGDISPRSATAARWQELIEADKRGAFKVSQLRERLLSSLAEEATRWADGKPTAQELEERQFTVFHGIEAAAKFGLGMQFRELCSAAEKAYPREEAYPKKGYPELAEECMRARVTFAKVVGDSFGLQCAYLELGSYTKQIKRVLLCFDGLIELKEASSAAELLAKRLEMLSAAQVTASFAGLLRCYEPRRQWNEVVGVVALLSKPTAAVTVVALCGQVLDAFGRLLSTEQTVRFVLQHIDGERAGVEGARLVRRVLSDLPSVEVGRDKLRLLTNRLIKACLENGEIELGARLLTDGIHAGLYVSAAKLPAATLRELLPRHLHADRLDPHRALLVALAGLSSIDVDHWSAWVRHFDERPLEQKIEALYFAQGRLPPPALCEQLYSWVIRSIKEGDFASAAWLLEHPDYDHKLAANNEARKRVVEALVERDPGHAQRALWFVIWEIDCAVAGRPPCLELARDICPLINCYLPGADSKWPVVEGHHQAAILMMKTLANAHHLPLNAHESRFEIYAGLHMWARRSLAHFECPELVTLSFNSECFNRPDLIVDEKIAHRGRLLLELAGQLIEFCCKLDSLERRSEVYEFLRDSQLGELLVQAGTQHAELRGEIACACARLIIDHRDKTLVDPFLLSLMILPYADSPAAFVPQVWIRCEDQSDTDLLKKAVLVVIDEVLGWEHPNVPTVLARAQGFLRVVCRGDWQFRIAKRLVGSATVDAGLAALVIAVNTLEGLPRGSEERRQRLREVISILRETAPCSAQDEIDSRPLLIGGVPGLLRTAVAGGLIDAEEKALLEAAAQIYQSFWVRTPAQLVERLEPAVASIKRLHDRSWNHELLMVGDTSKDADSIEDPGDPRVADHPIVCIAREICVLTFMQVEKRAVSAFVIQALPILDDLIDICKDNPVAFLECRSHRLVLLQGVIDRTADTAEGRPLWLRLEEQLRRDAAVWRQHPIQEVDQGRRPHRALRYSLKSLEQLALFAGSIDVEHSRMVRVIALLANYDEIWRQRGRPIAEGSRLLTRSRVALKLELLDAADPMGCAMIGYSEFKYLANQIHLINGKFNSRQHAREVLERLFDGFSSLYRHGCWLPINSTVELSNALFTCMMDYCKVYGEEGEEEHLLQRWFAIVGQPGRLKGLSQAALAERTQQYCGGVTDRVILKEKYGVGEVVKPTTDDICRLPFECLMQGTGVMMVAQVPRFFTAYAKIWDAWIASVAVSTPFGEHLREEGVRFLRELLPEAREKAAAIRLLPSCVIYTKNILE